MRILGLAFAGTATEERAAMARFAAETLGLERADLGGVPADMFALPDGSHFAVAGPRGEGDTSRTIGFLVADLDDALAELRAAGIEVDEPGGNDRLRYAHFRAPDGKRYELVEERAATPPSAAA
jgi:catechol 2,3-dioxygenase-like lactoylglutathione lyase family enzyme